MHRKLKRKFFRILFSILGVFFIVFAIATISLYITYQKVPDVSLRPDQQQNENKENEKPKDFDVNIAIFGVDESGLHTDVIFVLRYDSKFNRADFLSVPRDTYVEPTEEIREIFKQNNRRIHSYYKLTNLHGASGKKMRNTVSCLMLEELLQIPIHYYVRFDMRAFKAVVDSIGGVYMDVPYDMNYHDPYQNLNINLKKGPQLLNGDKAEQFVRFRATYATADLKRIEVQHLFIKELVKKVTSTQTLLSNARSLIQTAYNYIETDMPFEEMIKYIKYVKKIDMNQVYFHMMPCKTESIHRTSFVRKDQEKYNLLLNEILSNLQLDKQSQDYLQKIAVLNGSGINGLAQKTQQQLKNYGFQISRIATYEGEPTKQMRIFVKSADLGSELKKIFPYSENIVQPELFDQTEESIWVVLGTGENNQ